MSKPPKTPIGRFLLLKELLTKEIETADKEYKEWSEAMDDRSWDGYDSEMAEDDGFVKGYECALTDVLAVLKDKSKTELDTSIAGRLTGWL